MSIDENKLENNLAVDGISEDAEELENELVEDQQVEDEEVLDEAKVKEEEDEDDEEEVDESAHEDDDEDEVKEVSIPKTKAGVIQAAVDMLKKARKEDAQKIYAKMAKVDESEDDGSVDKAIKGPGGFYRSLGYPELEFDRFCIPYWEADEAFKVIMHCLELSPSFTFNAFVEDSIVVRLSPDLIVSFTNINKRYECWLIKLFTFCQYLQQ